MKTDWIGFVALLFAPLIICYTVGAFWIWDFSWIASPEYADVRIGAAVINVAWAVIASIAVRSRR